MPEQMTEPMNEQAFESLLQSILENQTEETFRVQTYEDRGLLTRDRGLVVRIGDSEFQVTIVQSR